MTSLNVSDSDSVTMTIQANEMESDQDQRHQQCTTSTPDLPGEVPDYTLSVTKLDTVEDILKDLMEWDSEILDSLASQIIADFDVSQFTGYDVNNLLYNNDGISVSAGLDVNRPQTISTQQVKLPEPATEISIIVANDSILHVRPEEANSLQLQVHSTETANESNNQIDQTEKGDDEFTVIPKIHPEGTCGFDSKLDRMEDEKQAVECVSENGKMLTKKDGFPKYFTGIYKRKTTKSQLTDRLDTPIKSSKREKRSNSGERQRYKCKLCAKTFRNKRYMATHYQRCTGKQQILPSYRPKKHFDSRGSGAMEHESTMARPTSGEIPTKKRYECEVCKKSFGCLRIHSIVHSNERPFHCQICGQSFKQNATLSVHLSRHSSPNPYQCDVCEKSFRYKRTLRAHSRFHSGEKSKSTKEKYECEACNMSFPFKCFLRRHSVIHSAERKYKCEICSKRFRRKSDVKQHVIVHRGIKIANGN